MTNQEAKATLANLEAAYRDLDPSMLTDDDTIQLVNKRIEAIGVAISAIEKQTPKRPNMTQNKYNENLWYLDCPSCGNYVGMWNSKLRHGDMYNNSNGNICPYCGQAIIDWEEGEL